MNDNEIKEISKVDKYLLKKIENILASELNEEEYDKFYNYFNEIRKPNIIVDIKDDENIKGLINQLQSNWNSLREWLKEEIEKVNGTENVCFQKVYYEEVLNKMNELEGDDK